jgi:hypothetical protein
MPELSEVIESGNRPSFARFLKPSDYAMSREAIFSREDSQEVRTSLAIYSAASATKRESTSRKVAKAKVSVEKTVSRSVAKITRMSEMIAAQYSQAYKSNMLIAETLGLDKRSSKLCERPPGFNIQDDSSLEEAFNYISTAHQNLLDFATQSFKRVIASEIELKKVSEQLVDVDDGADFYEEALNISYSTLDEKDEENEDIFGDTASVL